MASEAAGDPVSVSRVASSDFAWNRAGGQGVGTQLRRIIEESAEGDGRGPLNEQTLLALRHQGLTDASLWVSPSQADVSGFALANPAPDPAGPAEADVNLVVAPGMRGRGVGRSLAAAVLESFSGSRLSAWSHGNHPAARALASSLGFSRVRDLWLMRRDMREGLPPAKVPDGFVVRAFRPGRDEEAFLSVNAAAFARHPEQGDMTRDDLEQRKAEPWFDPEGFLVAERTGPDSSELVGFHWTKAHPGNPPTGEVYVVGVSPQTQGSGLGKVLTVAGLRYLRDAGMSEVILFVESDNAPAIALYERLGFTHAPEDTDVLYQREATDL